jgi:hypothetical protein
MYVHSAQVFNKSDNEQKGSLQAVIPAAAQSFGGKDEKALPEDALAKAEATLDLRIV